MSLNVLQVIPELDAGGAERTAADVARAVALAGGRAVVAAAGGRLADDIEAAGGQVAIGPYKSKNPWMMARNVARLRRLIHAHGIDVVHARSRAPAWSALRAARAERKPFVTTYHGAYSANGPIKRWYNSVMARGDRVIANSQFTADRILALYPWCAPRLEVVPRGVDLKRFDPDAVSPERIALVHRYWGAPAAESGARPWRILLPARLTAWKGHGLMLEALATWRATGAPRFETIFAGHAQERESYARWLNDEIARLELADCVRIVGHLADAPAAFAWADIVAAPSVRPEAFGRTAVEAQAMGKLLVASDHGGARETVQNEESGLLVPPGDSGALAAALDRFITMNHAERDAMRAAARLRARAFSLEAMCAKTLAIYEAVA